MSSLRNSLHRRNHKERSQLANRTRFGILEKHKDYVLRARDYHSKQDRLQRLREKASQRNKDEFYFGMTKERTRKGVHIQDRGNKALPTDVVKLLKTQDENYIRTKRMQELKRISKLKSQLLLVADALSGSDLWEGLSEDEIASLKQAGIFTASSKGKKKKNHVVFVQEGVLPEGNATTSHSLDDIELEFNDDLGWADSSTPQKPDVVPPPRPQNGDADSNANDRLDLLKELCGAIRRHTLLRYTERELEMQKLLMSKGAHSKIQGIERVDADDDESDDEDAIDSRKGRTLKQAVTASADESKYKPRVYKWRLERKR